MSSSVKVKTDNIRTKPRGEDVRTNIADAIDMLDRKVDNQLVSVDDDLIVSGAGADAAKVGRLLFAGDTGADRARLTPSVVNHDRITVSQGTTYDVRDIEPLRKIYFNASSLENLPEDISTDDYVLVMRYPINYAGNVALFICYSFYQNRIWTSRYMAPSQGEEKPELSWKKLITNGDLPSTYTFTRTYTLGNISPESGIATASEATTSMFSGLTTNRGRRYGAYTNKGYEICLFAYGLNGSDTLNYIGMWDGERYTPGESSTDYHYYTTVDRAAFDNAYKIRILVRKTDGSAVLTTDTDCVVMFEDNSDDERIVYTDLKRIAGWLNETGGYYNTPATQTQNVSHSEKIPVRPCHKYYVGIPVEDISNIGINTIGCCYDKDGVFIKPILKTDLTVEPYSSCDFTPVTFVYKNLFSFVTPPECAFFMRNLFGASYVQTLTDMPIHPYGGSGNYLIKTNDPFYQRKKNKTIGLIGPSTLSIDGMKRTVVTSQSSKDFCVHILGSANVSGTRYYVIKNGVGEWNTKADGSGTALSTSILRGTYGNPEVGDTIVLGTQYICGLQQYLYPWYKKVKSFAYQGSKTGHHDGSDGPNFRAKGGWDYIVGDEVDLSDCDEIIIFLNTQQSILLAAANSEYLPDYSYVTGEYVYKDGMIYKANKNTTGEWKEEDWDRQEFSASTFYAKNSYVTKDGYCYICVADGGHQGAWNNDHFDPVCPLGTANTTDVKTTIGATMDMVRYYVESRGLNPSKVYLRINEGNVSNVAQRRYSEEIRKFAEENGYDILVSMSRGSDYMGSKTLSYDGTHSNNEGNRVAGENIRYELVGF